MIKRLHLSSIGLSSFYYLNLDSCAWAHIRRFDIVRPVHADFAVDLNQAIILLTGVQAIRIRQLRCLNAALGNWQRL